MSDYDRKSLLTRSRRVTIILFFIFISLVILDHSFVQHNSYTNTVFVLSLASGAIMFFMLWYTYKLKLSQLDHDRIIAEQNNQRLTNLYAALSQCNQAIVRCKTTQELYTQICQNAVIYGGMKMAWIGIYDEQDKQLKAVAYAGEGTDYLSTLTISVDANDPTGQGPSGKVFRNDEPYWCQDFQNSPTTQIWHERAKQYDLQSSAALPLHINSRVIGTFNLYSDQINGFDEMAQKLLIEMTIDIDYALENLQRDAARKEVEKALKESEQRLQAIIQTEPECVKTVDNRCRLTQMNPAGLAMLEASTLEEAQNYSLTDFLLPEHRAAFIEMHRRVMNGQNSTLEFEIIGLKGTHRWLETHATPMRDAEGKVTSLLGVTRDITQRKSNESNLLLQTQAMEQSPNSIIITDYKANIEYVNNAFITNTGYTSDEVIGKNPRLLKSGNTPEHAYDSMWNALLRQEKWQGEFINKRKDGTNYIYSINIAPVLDKEGKTTHYIAIEEDISEQKKTQEKIHYLANFDPLTSLPNRIQMDDHLQYTLNIAKRNEGRFALIFLDLDHFKNINDTLGHSIGDLLLMELAKRLSAAVREEDTVSRMGGDEFVLLLPETDVNGAAQVAQKLLASIANPFKLADHALTVTASLGIALYPSDGMDIETLSKNADVAMYRAKQEGRNSYCFFTQEMQKNSQRNLDISNALHSALQRNEFHLAYQPQFSTKYGAILGAEALIRWEHPQLGLVSPSEFIPIAEDNGTILSIGEWILRTAVSQAALWHQNGIPIMMAVNISAVQFRHPNLPTLVTDILEQSGLPPQYLEIELTERVAMHNPQDGIKIMNTLHDIGIRMSIDDFGTGYSSLSYLKQFKVYKLKIDHSFVRDISTDPEDKAIVRAVIQLAHSLELITIAEGVETLDQLQYLQQQGCDEIQGYYYSKPLLPGEFESFISTFEKEK